MYRVHRLEENSVGSRNCVHSFPWNKKRLRDLLRFLFEIEIMSRTNGMDRVIFLQ